MPRILHIADVHFDTPFACKASSVRTALQKGVRSAFERAVDDALANSVDAVVIAGDLFDDSRLRLETEGLLLRQLSRLGDAGICVVYATGNHDPAGERGRVNQLDWPGAVVVVGSHDPVETVLETADGPLRIVAVGHESATVSDNLVAHFPRFSDDIPTVGLVHANVAASLSGTEHHPYAPCTAADLDSLGYDYWALGHIHIPSSPTPSGVAWYAGCIQGRHFRESGPRGGLLVEVNSGLAPKVTHRSYAAVHWEVADLTDVSDLRSLRALDAAARSAVEGIKAGCVADAIAIRFVLRGESELWEQLRNETAELAQRWEIDFGLLHVEVDTRLTYRPLEMEVLEAETTVLAEALSIFDEVVNDKSGAMISEFVSEETRAADGAIVPDVDRLRRELAERFVLPAS